MPEQFRKPNGDKDERMEDMAQKIKDIHICLLGSIPDRKPGLIAEVAKNTRFRKTITNGGIFVAVSSVTAFVTGKIKGWF